MNDPLQQALDSIADGREIDWAILEAQTPEALRPRLQGLREIASITRAHSASPRTPVHTTPFLWGFLRVDTYVASGAHGDVYRAWDPRLERVVALKLLRYDASADDRASLAISEGRLLARVRHPNVVTVHGADRIDGQAGIWMEFVEGQTLRHKVETNGPMSGAEASMVGQTLCAALAAIHSAGLIHRDVKAQNAICDAEGRLTLMDLGGGREDERPDDRLEGTPVYLAPELLRGDPATAASDIYALGVLLFFLVTGRYPVAATSIDELRARHDCGRHERLSDLPEQPLAFASAVDRALSPAPADRFASASEMRAALDAEPKPVRRRPTALLLAAAALVTSVGLSAGWLLSGGDHARVTRASKASEAVIAGAPFGTSSQSPAITPPGTADSRPPSAGPSPQSPVAVPESVSKPSTLRLPLYTLGVPSHDGRFFPYVDGNGDVEIWEVASGRSRRLTSEGSLTESARQTLASPSGDRVAYAWALAGGAFELRVIDADGRHPQTLIGRQTQYQPIPLDWSRNGSNVLCWLHQANDTADLALVSTAGGPPRVLSTFRTSDITNGLGELSVASLSPDGRFVVLTVKTAAEPVHYDLAILATDGSNPDVLVSGVNDEASPGWTSDGRQVVFARPGADSPATDHDAWVLPVLDGVAQAEPRIAARNIGASNRMDVTDDGRLYIAVTMRSTEIFTRSIDLTGDTAPGDPTRIVKQQLGEHVAPSWSPDGRTLAYFTTQQRSSPGSTPVRTLSILDLQSGRTQTVPSLGYQDGYTPHWFPDSHSLVVFGGADFDREVGYYRIDVTTGQTSPLVLFSRESPLTNPGFCEVATGGRDLLYGDDEKGIVARNLESGLEAVVVAKRADAQLGRFGVSPDGQSIAFVTRSRADGLNVVAIEIQSIGGTARVLARAVAPDRLDFQAFTPDGSSVVFIRARPQSGDQLWRVAVAGGEPNDMHLTKTPTQNAVSFSPDGRRIAYPERTNWQDLHILPLNLGKR